VARRKAYVRPESGRPAAGAGRLALPGGHNEQDEPYNITAEREAWEETGLAVKAFKWDGLRYDLHTRFTMECGRHHLTIYVPTYVTGGVLGDLEPEKHEPWMWVTLSQAQEMVGCDQSWLPVDIMMRYREELYL
jgi:8-oxo-dGTP pyrophosphatase MutT (NUDIX family)